MQQWATKAADDDDYDGQGLGVFSYIETMTIKNGGQHFRFLLYFYVTLRIKRSIITPHALKSIKPFRCCEVIKNTTYASVRAIKITLFRQSTATKKKKKINCQQHLDNTLHH